jgi:hypothetical protein
MRGAAISRLLGLAAAILLANGCGFGAGADFTLSNLAVESSYTCQSGASNAPYDLHATISSHNGTSSAVSIKTVTAVMTWPEFMVGGFRRLDTGTTREMRHLRPVA